MFTEYLRNLDSSGEPPDRDSFALVWQGLRTILRREIQRRGLWHSSPTYLGVFGFSSWQEESREQGVDALEELTADAYTFVFIDRLRSLKEQLKVKDNIEGLVRLNLRHFLHERQKRNDPIGFKLFSTLRSAVRGEVADGRLRVLAGDPKVQNETTLGFSDSGPVALDAEIGIERVVPLWTGNLMPDLVTARGKRRQQVIARLQRHLPELRDEGVRRFHFKQLVDSLKRDVRHRWDALLRDADLEIAEEEARASFADMLRQVAPELGFEQRESFQQLLSCVDRELEELHLKPATRRYLAELWQFFCIYAAEGDGGGPAQRNPPPPENEALPSRRQLAEQLGIPRDRIPELLATLGRLINDCRQGLRASN